MPYIPDLHIDLSRYGASVPASRTSYGASIVPNAAMHTWALHDAGTPERLWKILEQFRASPAFAVGLDCNAKDGSSACVVTFKARRDESPRFQFPSMRETLVQEVFAYSAELDTHEMGDAYLAGYGLGMLARYFPDLWVRCLESHCSDAKLIELLILVLGRKFPGMVLRAMSGEDIVVSHLPPSWYT